MYLLETVPYARGIEVNACAAPSMLCSLPLYILNYYFRSCCAHVTRLPPPSHAHACVSEISLTMAQQSFTSTRLLKCEEADWVTKSPVRHKLCRVLLTLQWHNGAISEFDWLGFCKS